MGDRGTNNGTTRGAGVRERVSFTGTLPYQLYIHLKNNGLTQNRAFVRYKYAGIPISTQACPASGWVGCDACANWAACPATHYPKCDGTDEVNCMQCSLAPCEAGATCDGKGYVCTAVPLHRQAWAQ